MATRGILPTLLCLAAALTAACGYRTGLSPALPDGRTAASIGVEIFGNETLLPNIEQPLHAATSESILKILIEAIRRK